MIECFHTRRFGKAFLALFVMTAMGGQKGLARDFPAEAQQLVLQPACEARDRKLADLTADWGMENPAAALKWIMPALPEGEMRFRTLRGILPAWAEKDQPAAMEWALDLPEGKTRDRALANTLSGWARKDPAAAAEWLMKQPKGNAVDLGLPKVVAAWLKKDPAAAFAWVEKLQGAKRVDLMFDTGSYWASVNLQAATERVLKKDLDAPLRERIIVEAAHVWAVKAPGVATEWAMKLPEGRIRNAALLSVASVLAMKDPSAASEWAMKLPDEDLRKAAMEMASRQKKNKAQGITVEDKLGTIMIGHVEFNDAAVQDVVEQLNQAGRESDPEKTGVTIRVKVPSADSGVSRVTAVLDNRTLGSDVRFICRAAGLECHIENDRVTIEDREEGKTTPDRLRPTLKAEPDTGQITIETDRYTARMELGRLTLLYNKLTKNELIGAGDPEVSKTVPYTALIVQEAPLSGPVFRHPVFDDRHKSLVTVNRINPAKLSVTYRGLVGDDKNSTFFPEDSLSVMVSVAGASGDLLVDIRGSSPETSVAGTAFGYTGLTRRHIVYSPNDGGAVAHGDTASPASGTREWCNMNMVKRTGSLCGGIWCVPVTVMAAEEDPKSAFAIWCEDDELLPKYYIRGSKSMSYASLEYPPYEKIRSTRSVTWHVNTYAGGWTEAAKPYADSLVRRGFTKNRAPWAKDISLIIQLPDLQPTWWKPLLDIFPAEDRRHIMLYVYNWRNQDFDRNHWDYTPTPGFLEGAKNARDAGFHTLVYLQPTLCWGDPNLIADPDDSEAVRKMQEQVGLDPFGKHKVEYAGPNIAYAPWRRLMLDAARSAILNFDVQGLYLDSTFTFMPDGRGRIEGMTSYEGMHRYINELRRMSPDLFMGNEYPNELMAWGTDFSLHPGLEWCVGEERNKARHSHPIYNYLFRDVMVTMTHDSRPARKHFHYLEEIAERTGQVAAMNYDDVALLRTDSPESQLWMAKARLFAHRGLRPYYPDAWEPTVMSYLKAADGTIFVYEETDYGSRLVERASNGPIVQYARTWKKTSLKTDDGKILNWIGLADDGTWIGLVPETGHVLMPRTGQPPSFRITQLPEGVGIQSYTLKPAGVIFHLVQDKAKGNPGPVLETMGKPAAVTIRFRAPGKPEDIRTESSKREARELFAHKGDSGTGADMLSDALLSLTEVAGSQAPGGRAYDVAVPLNEAVEIVWGK